VLCLIYVKKYTLPGFFCGFNKCSDSVYNIAQVVLGPLGRYSLVVIKLGRLLGRVTMFGPYKFSVRTSNRLLYFDICFFVLVFWVVLVCTEEFLCDWIDLVRLSFKPLFNKSYDLLTFFSFGDDCSGAWFCG